MGRLREREIVSESGILGGIEKEGKKEPKRERKRKFHPDHVLDW